MDRNELTRRIKARALELGFDKVGIAPAEPPERSDFLASWLARGFHGSMAWMERTAGKRADPRRLLPGARSIVSVAANYYTGEEPASAPERAAISRYAWGEDYHLLLEDKLAALCAFLRELRPEANAKYYVDTGPVLEKAIAQRAGLGWIGKHTNLITMEYGSWVFLGEVVTDVELEPDRPAFDHCGTCTRCIEACPTGAIVEPYVLDSRLCISYLTIELRRAIPPELRPALGNMVYGCDICQEVCPWNLRFARPSQEAGFLPRAENRRPPLRELIRLSLEAFRQRFRRSAIKRAKWRGLLRNAAVALGNSGNIEAVPDLMAALDHQEPLVRSHAAWALGRIGGSKASVALEAALARERDPEVRREIESALAECRARAG